MMRITGLTEIILYVENMERMVSFYRDTIGLKIQYPRNVDHFENEHYVKFWTGMCTLSLRSGGKGLHGVDAPRLVFGVTDIDHARSFLTQRDVKIGDVYLSSPGLLVCDGLDPEENKFSLEHQTIVSDIPSQPLSS